MLILSSDGKFCGIAGLRELDQRGVSHRKHTRKAGPRCRTPEDDMVLKHPIERLPEPKENMIGKRLEVDLLTSMPLLYTGNKITIPQS